MILSEERGLLDCLRKKKPWEDEREAVTFQPICDSLVRAERVIVSSHCDHSPLECPYTRERRASSLCIKELIPIYI